MHICAYIVAWRPIAAIYLNCNIGPSEVQQGFIDAAGVHCLVPTDAASLI